MHIKGGSPCEYPHTFEILRTHSLDYAAKIQESTLSKDAALWSYLLYLRPKVTIPLMAMTFSEAQCNRIQSPALRAVLSKLHLNRYTARSIIHGPLLYGGMNLPNLYTTQGIYQLKFLLGHLRAKDKSGKLICITHGGLQLLVRMSKHFLNLPYKVTSLLGCPSWLLSVWHFIDHLGLQINIHEIMTEVLQGHRPIDR
jgi:hypothetical protein